MAEALTTCLLEHFEKMNSVLEVRFLPENLSEEGEAHGVVRIRDGKTAAVSRTVVGPRVRKPRRESWATPPVPPKEAFDSTKPWHCAQITRKITLVVEGGFSVAFEPGDKLENGRLHLFSCDCFFHFFNSDT